MNDNTRSLPHVVIIGAGFGGLATAQVLSNQAIRVTVIDKANHHLFQPLLYQVATAELTASEIAVPIRHVFKNAANVEVILETVKGIDAERQTVATESGMTIQYDFLVLATGARPSYFNHDGWENFAPGLKSIDDAHRIKNLILLAFERAEIETDPQRRRALLTFVIVGGGPTGVELAGAVAEISRKALVHEFRHIAPESSRIILVDAGPNILKGFDEKLSKRALKDLKSLGVEVMNGIRVKSIGPDSVDLDGNQISTTSVIWAAGVTASPAAEWLGIQADHSQRIPVDANMAVRGFEQIYAIGDTSNYVPAGSDTPLPGVAAVAKQQGKFLGRYILALVSGKPLPTFKYRDFGSMATIGRNKAVVRLLGWRLTGAFAWLLWGVVHIYFLIGFPRRFRVAFNWFWNYFTSQRSVRLIFSDSRTPPQNSP
ncbi:NAD(P)/FAD-dependent oxidoreductase [Methylomonas methanica]|uniref:NADH:ubiquinone reductase (non-electrogenic) n=1 Tax=Methylomonas methanica (strain DSM 25384 / MC09) TaxID=857087 RepID=F9ZW13_METMM|nr:FAD-dependent oxidoreductase [Methylomonas methanica]AEG00817.1 NADH dehydrogenase (ubiquinone) [Methylomonas methanica MC09]